MYIYRNPYADLSELIDSVFNDDFFKASNTVKSSICSNNFPPSDISFDSDATYIIDIALAGFTEDDISIDYEDGYVTVKGTMPKKDETRKYAKNGIKVVDSFTTSFAVDITKYNVEKLSATMSNGILTIKIPVKKDFLKSKSFGINGKKAKPAVDSVNEE